MNRVPIRIRLALFFSAAAAVLLTAVAGFGYARLASGQSHDLDLELRQRAQDLVVPVSRPDASLTDLAGTGFVERGESFAEVVTPSGQLLDATPTLHRRPVLTDAEAARAARGTLTVDRNSAPGLDEPARLLATPFTRDGRPLVLVVGDTRENGLEVLRRVRTQLLVGIPLLVLLTFVGAYAVAGAALRPVEAMRRRASELTAYDPALRLPIPRSADEIARLGRTLNALLARVEKTLDRERAFVAHASHELRTPLALLRTELELAVRRPRPAPELAEAIRSAEVEVDRLQRLAEDLLLLAQAGEGELAVHLEDVRVLDLVRDVGARFAPALAESGRHLETNVGEEIVRADRGRLQQALTNLVGNALEHGRGVVRAGDARSRRAAGPRRRDEGDGLRAGAARARHGALRTQSRLARCRARSGDRGGRRRGSRRVRSGSVTSTAAPRRGSACPQPRQQLQTAASHLDPLLALPPRP